MSVTKLRLANSPNATKLYVDVAHLGSEADLLQRDGLHLTDFGHRTAALAFGFLTIPALEKITKPHVPGVDTVRLLINNENLESLRQLIISKNRLWFDYWRPQNWAFLAGDRTAQPSSRDHLDPSKRWFPPEREAFLPLIEAKEKQIDALAAQLAAGNAGK